MTIFDHLLGNEPIKTYLSHALASQQLHHTILFSGAAGIGKEMFAKALAQHLLESSASRIHNQTHPDLHILRPESKSGTHLVEPLREMIKEIHRPPFEAKRKIFVLDEAHRMPPAAANMLLKTLEEPDLDCQIILISSAPNELLPTILSRSIHLAFQPIAQDLIAQFLQHNHSVSQERAHMLARLSCGSIGQALHLLQDDRCEKTGQILINALEKNISSIQAIAEIERLLDDLEGIEFHQEAERLIAIYLMWVRDQELQRVSGDERLSYFSRPATDVQAISFSAAQQIAIKAKTALERNVRLSACLDFMLCTV